MTLFLHTVQYNYYKLNHEDIVMTTQIKDRAKNIKINPHIRSMGISVLHLMAAFILSIGSVSGEMKPFGVTLVAVSKSRNIIFSAVGAILGYIINGFDEQSGKYIACVMIAGIMSFLFQKADIQKIIALKISISPIAITVINSIIAIKDNEFFDRLLMICAEAVLSLGISYCYYKSLNANFKCLRFRALPAGDMICIAISFSSLFLILGNVKILELYPLWSLAVCLILLSIRYDGAKWGVILSLTLGFMLGASTNNMALLCSSFAFSAMTASLFTSFASLGISIIFMLCVAFFSISAGENGGLALFISSLMGIGLFLLIPPVLCDRIEKYFDNGKELTPDSTLRQSIVLKLRFASTAMTAVSESVEQVREKINDVTRRNNETLKDNMTKEEYITREVILEKTNQIRAVASDQFYSISSMLDDLANEFNNAEIFDSVSSEKIRKLLAEHEIYPENISSIVDKYSRMRVEILLKDNEQALSDKTLQNEIGKVCNRYFDTGRITDFKNETMLSFTEKPNYMLAIGFAQHSAQGTLCGDTVKTVNDGKGHSILIISDGMGKGSRAALDGAMGAGLISRLINAGFGFDSALKIVNSALLVKSNDESLATLDIANIDLFTGKCEIFKAGAPASYIIKNGNITKCELSSMPAGILRGIEFAKRTAVLSLGDSIIMMSDGITDLGEQWLKGVMSTMPYSVQECADYILNCALKETKNKKRDDMSVIFAKLERNHNERDF